MSAGARFQLGRLVVTPGALKAFERMAEQEVRGATPGELLARHARGDWGDMDAEDLAANDAALHDESRIFSSYKFMGGTCCFWVITEADRSATTILLPNEY